MDPACGDVTYTQTLLASPPEFVTYTTYAEALANGTLREHGRRSPRSRIAEDRISVWAEMVSVVGSAALNRVRRTGLLFREPFRFFSVAEGVYDLVHMHVFAARFFKSSCPLVVTSGSPLGEVYRDAFRVPPTRLRLMEICERRLARALKVNAYSFWLPQASRLAVYTDHFVEYARRMRLVDDDHLDKIPIFVPVVSQEKASVVPNRIGFVAKDFASKGGETLLRAFQNIRHHRPDTELMIVGSDPRMPESALRAAGISWYPYVDRTYLLTTLMPSFAVFAYPTQCDCISYVVLEAMSMGIPVATSDYPSMPETVAYGQAGLVSPVGDAEALAGNILELLDPTTNAVYRERTRTHFVQTYSDAAVLPKLRACYDAALAQTPRCGS